MDVGAAIRVKGVTFQPHIVLLVLLWAILHDRPRSWACDPVNWSTTTLRPARIPSDATVSRQLRRLPAQVLMRALTERLRGRRDPSLIHIIDGKPLPVGGASTDPDARVGRGAGLKAKGYKLHAVWAGRPMPEAYRVEPLNACETKVAEALLPELAGGGGYLLGDGEYDANPVYAAAGAAGLQLLAPREDPEAGPGHIRQSPYRLRAIELLRTRFGQEVLALRRRVEGSFGNLVSFGGGLGGGPPPWVRRLHRVRAWVWAKLLINGVRILIHHGLAA
jgi:hypothetical protein